MKEVSSDVAESPHLPTWFLSPSGANTIATIFEELVNHTKEWMKGVDCALWWLDVNRNGFRLVATAKNSRDLDTNANFFPYDAVVDLKLLVGENPVELAPDPAFHLPDFKLGSSLVARIHFEKRNTGILIVFPKKRNRTWSELDRKTLRSIANSGAEHFGDLEKREKLTALVALLHEMNEKTMDYDLYDLVLSKGKALLTCDRAVIRGVNPQNGHLTFKRSSPAAPEGFPLEHGKGITGLALVNEMTYRIDDVTLPEWVDDYRALWPKANLPRARSELAVPILRRKYPALVKTHKEFVVRPFGVLNFESPTIASFSRFDQDCAEAIAQTMAMVLERIEYDIKLGKVRRASQKLATQRDWDSIVDVMLPAIRDALGYEFVSLSIVDPNTKVIRCVRVIGLDEKDKEKFRKRAVHELASDHVQADVVRNHQTDVPSPDDPRLSDIAQQFGLDKLIRVFVPMRVWQNPNDRKPTEVIGSVSAGYDRTYRKYIYQRDVQLLKILVAFGTNAMESYQRGTTDLVSHEMNAPLTSVRGQLDRLSRKYQYLTAEQIQRALEYMATDTDLLYYQVQQLEYILGGPAIKQPLNLEPVLLFRDIIYKTMNQLKPLVKDQGLDPRKVGHKEEDVHKVKEMYLDKTKISQVLFNLFMNAVKYFENADSFRIHISADEEGQSYVIKFCDWGIGIPEGLEEKIFWDRYRGPVAPEKVIPGSGLGLTIARRLMREHGGDLVLKNHYKPTEFHLVFPKKLRRPS